MIVYKTFKVLVILLSINLCAQNPSLIFTGDSLKYEKILSPPPFSNGLSDYINYVLADSMQSGAWILLNCDKASHDQGEKNCDTLITGYYMNGRKHGAFTHYISKDDKLVFNYSNGMLHGVSYLVSRELTTETSYSINYEYGKKEGLSILTLSPLGYDFLFYQQDSLEYAISFTPCLSKKVNYSTSLLVQPISGRYEVYDYQYRELLSLFYSNGVLEKLSSYSIIGDTIEIAEGLITSPNLLDFNELSSIDLYQSLVSGLYQRLSADQVIEEKYKY